jgi:hypothetical protein
MGDWHAFAVAVVAVVIGIVLYEVISSFLGGQGLSVA